MRIGKRIREVVAHCEQAGTVTSTDMLLIWQTVAHQNCGLILRRAAAMGLIELIQHADHRGVSGSPFVYQLSEGWKEKMQGKRQVVRIKQEVRFKPPVNSVWQLGMQC